MDLVEDGSLEPERVSLEPLLRHWRAPGVWLGRRPCLTPLFGAEAVPGTRRAGARHHRVRSCFASSADPEHVRLPRLETDVVPSDVPGPLAAHEQAAHAVRR